MEPIIDGPSDSSFCRDEKEEAMDLLEEGWFFENLFKVKLRVPRCYSDPCPSTGLSQDVLVKGSDGANGVSVHANLIQRAPSMPPCRVREEDDKKGSNFITRSKLVRQPSVPVVLQAASKLHCTEMKEHEKSECNSRRSRLLRTPSLPPSIGREDKFQASNSRTGRSPRQPSTPTHDDIWPRRQTSKGYSIPKCRPARHTEAESINTEGIKEMRRRYLNQRTMRKSLSDLEFEEVQGFKDLGFSFEKETLSPSLASILPGLQEKNKTETEQDKAVRRPYLSEAWLVQSCAPTTPNRASKQSAEDTKAQIKYWARAVASNIRQEC